MSRRMVGRAIDKLLTDDDLRARFVFDRIGAMAKLRGLGIVLTADEIDVFCQTDVRVWSSSRIAISHGLH
jgi:hypothetical protein